MTRHMHSLFNTMDKFATLEPTRLYNQPTRSLFSRKPDTTILVPTIGRLPIDLDLLLLTHLPIPAIPAYSLASRATARLATDERIWEPRWRALGIDSFDLGGVLDELEAKNRGGGRATILVEDEFGDFARGDDDVVVGRLIMLISVLRYHHGQHSKPSTNERIPSSNHSQPPSHPTTHPTSSSHPSTPPTPPPLPPPSSPNPVPSTSSPSSSPPKSNPSHPGNPSAPPSVPQ